MPLEHNASVPPPIDEGARSSLLPPQASGGYGPEYSQLKEFFTGELKDIYDAEQQLVTSLPKMAAAATSAALRQLFESHLQETRQHVVRLEKAFALMGQSTDAVRCEAMAGIVAEGDKAIENTKEGSFTRDAALIMAAQKVEHYEMTTYGSLAYLAHVLGLLDVKGLLEATLDEEKGADKMLSLAASSGINRASVLEGA